MDNSSAVSWSLQTFGSAAFGDDRLTKRSVIVASSFLEHAQSSIPKACQTWAATKAAYRFFANRKVQSRTMLEAHQKQLLVQMLPLDTVLVAQDTMTLNLSNRQIEGLGSIGDGGNTKRPLRGLFVHSALAMTTTGIPIGLAWQNIYVRSPATRTEAYRKKAKMLPVSEKETGRWVEAIEHTKQVLHGTDDKNSPKAVTNTRIVMVGDRESDIYEVFQKGQELGIDILVRTAQNRKLDDDTKLFDKVLGGDVVATYETDVPLSVHKTRKAILTIRKSVVTIQQAKARRTSLPISMTVLNVMEEHPENEIEPIHWMLTTSLVVNTPKAAIEKVQWYMYRWRIERFHYTLKTGAFSIEKLQFETFGRFSKAITMYSFVACHVLQSLYMQRDHPEENANTIFSTHEIQALQLLKQKRMKLQLQSAAGTAALTIHEAIQIIAGLGGHLGRKSDGPPGVKTLWQGFQVLQYMVEGMLLTQHTSSQV